MLPAEATNLKRRTSPLPVSARTDGERMVVIERSVVLCAGAVPAMGTANVSIPLIADAAVGVMASPRVVVSRKLRAVTWTWSACSL
jgi:hypothetical protein